MKKNQQVFVCVNFVDTNEIQIFQSCDSDDDAALSRTLKTATNRFYPHLACFYSLREIFEMNKNGKKIIVENPLK